MLDYILSVCTYLQENKNNKANLPVVGVYSIGWIQLRNAASYFFRGQKTPMLKLSVLLL